MEKRVTLLSGGVGGAKLALGFSHAMAPERLTIIANSGDDLDLFGLRICPDSDILAYTLAGEVEEAQGWGIRGDTYAALERVRKLGGAGWFNLGDTDLGLHLFRTELLAGGVGLAEITRRITEGLGVKSTLLPMCEQPVATRLMTEDGELALQEYLVRRRAEPAVTAIRFEGAESATVAPGVAEALADSQMIVIAPSNPLISIGPILAVPEMGRHLRESRALKVAVSPIVGGKSLKGPSDRMLEQLGHGVSPVAVAKIYGDLLDVLVVDEQDRGSIPELEGLGLRAVAASTVMSDLDAKTGLAQRLLALCEAA